MDFNFMQLAQPGQEKLCINCKYCHAIPMEGFLCLSPRRRRSLVTGIADKTWCNWARTLRDANSCGPNGLWYEQREGGLDSQNQV